MSSITILAVLCVTVIIIGYALITQKSKENYIPINESFELIDPSDSIDVSNENSDIEILDNINSENFSDGIEIL